MKDVLKALALGASAVGIGKPIFFSLAVGGQEGVLYMLHLLRTELEAAMAICGIESISDITPQHGHSPGEFCSQDATLHSTIVTLNTYF